MTLGYSVNKYPPHWNLYYEPRRGTRGGIRFSGTRVIAAAGMIAHDSPAMAVRSLYTETLPSDSGIPSSAWLNLLPHQRYGTLWRRAEAASSIPRNAGLWYPRAWYGPQPLNLATSACTVRRGDRYFILESPRATWPDWFQRRRPPTVRVSQVSRRIPHRAPRPSGQIFAMWKNPRIRNAEFRSAARCD